MQQGAMSQVLRKQLTVRNKLGIHARVANRIVQTSNQFKSSILLIKNGREADAKSMLDVMALSCPQGTLLEISAEGEDSIEAIAALTVLFDDKFGED